MRTIQRWFWIIFGLVFVVAFAWMAVQNTDPVQLRFIVWKSAPEPLSYFVFASFIVGFVFGFFLSLIEILRLRLRLRKSHRTRDLLEREVHALRNQPLFDEPPTTEGSTAVSENGKERLTHDGLPEQAFGDIDRD